MKFVVALFLSSTSAITLNQLQQLKVKDCTGTQGSCSAGCTWNGTACAAGLSTACTGTEGSCSAGCTWNGTKCAASAATACTGTEGACSAGTEPLAPLDS